MKKTEFILIFWTCGEVKEARDIVSKLVEKHLIACGTLIPSVESIFRWHGKIEKEKEIKVILKSRKDKFESIRRFISQNATYEVPEILAVPIMEGHKPYLDWLEKETKKA